MALDFVKGQAVSIGSRVLSKSVSNLPGLLGTKKGRGSDYSPSAPIEKNKYSTKHYSFPIDVEAPPGMGNHGHYIMFNINEQKSAELRFGDRETKKDGSETVREEMADKKIPKYIKRLVGEDYQRVENKDAASEHIVENYVETDDTSQKFHNLTGRNYKQTKPARGKGSTVYVDRAPTIRLDTAITLYMPPQVKVTYGANWTDTPIGVGAELGVDVYGQIMAGGSTKEIVKSGLDKIGPALSEGITKMLLATVGAMPGMAGTREAYEMATGVVISDRMELAFKGIAKRQFQYDFKMIPKNKDEADEIRKIVFAFKANMMPEFAGGNRSGRKLRVPNTFDIQYMYNGDNNEYLHHISTCVLTNMDVTYGGDRYKTFTANEEGAPPVETQITLNFQELELITRERIHEGY